MENTKRLHRCCFTGHRPEKIGMSEEDIKQRLRLAIKDAICEHYSKSCFQIRNCYMVDNSARVISAYCGISGGTKNTILYAQRKKVEIVNVCNDKL